MYECNNIFTLRWDNWDKYSDFKSDHVFVPINFSKCIYIVNGIEEFHDKLI